MSTHSHKNLTYEKIASLSDEEVAMYYAMTKQFKAVLLAAEASGGEIVTPSPMAMRMALISQLKKPKKE